MQQSSADSYAQQVVDALDWLSAESAAHGGGRMLPLHVTPYIMGLPYRMGAFEDLLARMASRDDLWFARGDALVEAALPHI